LGWDGGGYVLGWAHGIFDRLGCPSEISDPGLSIITTETGSGGGISSDSEWVWFLQQHIAHIQTVPIGTINAMK